MNPDPSSDYLAHNKCSVNAGSASLLSYIYFPTMLSINWGIQEVLYKPMLYRVLQRALQRLRIQKEKSSELCFLSLDSYFELFIKYLKYYLPSGSKHSFQRCPLCTHK